MLLALLGCVPSLEEAPDPGDWTTEGPGIGRIPLTEDQLFEPCAWLNGDERSAEHHNLVMVHDGWLVFPWAPEYGGGGVTFFDVSDPCAPEKVGEGWSDEMRESHTLSFGTVGGREYLAVDWHAEQERGGIGFFDVTDRTNPVWVSSLELPNYFYPDAYFRVALSTFWQGDRLYVSAGLLGVFTVDVSDPLNPVILDQLQIPAHIAGTTHVIGNLAMVSSAGLARAIVYDISDPDDWLVLSDYDVVVPGMSVTGFYFANVGGEYALYARKDEGGGPVVYDLREPTDPPYVGHGADPEADGGYVFRHEDWLFQGESNFGALYDFTTPSDPVQVARFQLKGDLDTVTPMGAFAVVSVDEKGNPGEASGIFPWTTEHDARGPQLPMTVPADGATWVPLTSRLGLSFDELIESASVFEGTVRVWDQQGARVPGRFYVQESLVNWVPDAPLDPETTYWVEVTGVADISGNPMASPVRLAFSTGEEVQPWPE